MVWLINYIRQCFCKHEFQTLKGYAVRRTRGYTHFEEPVTTLVCKHCGYTRQFWG